MKLWSRGAAYEVQDKCEISPSSNYLRYPKSRSLDEMVMHLSDDFESLVIGAR